MLKDFEWRRGVTPLSSHLALVASVVGYLAGIGILKRSIHTPVGLPTWKVATHNLILCLGSLAMFIGCAWECAKVAMVIGSKPMLDIMH